MADNTGIEWADATWQATYGCSIVSPGCANCYAMNLAARIEAMALGGPTPYARLTQPSKAGAVWNGTVRPARMTALTQPLRWRKPRRIFVDSMADLFAEGVEDAWIDRAFAVMALCPQHVFMVLTKRPERMKKYFEGDWQYERIYSEMDAIGAEVDVPHPYRRTYPNGVPRPLPNVWLGTSCEDQKRADERIPHLLTTPAARRFVSAEPLLGPIDMRTWLSDEDGCEGCDDGGDGPNRCARNDLPRAEQCPTKFAVFNCTEGPRDALGCPEWVGADRVTLDLVIIGGESGPDARPMHPDWVRSIRDQCVPAGVPFFFKQWGEWAPGECAGFTPTRAEQTATWWNGRWDFDRVTPAQSLETHIDDAPDLYRIGKRRAGAMLDGREWREMPGV